MTSLSADPYATGWDASDKGWERGTNPYTRALDKMRWFAGFDECERAKARAEANAQMSKRWRMDGFADA